MNYKEIKEYQTTWTLNMKIPDFSNGNRVGILNSSVGSFQIWRMTIGNEVHFAAIDSNIGPTKPICYMGFEVGHNLLIARNASIDSQYRRKGIASELFLFVNKVEGYKIINDVLLSDEGESLWLSFINSPKFTTKILYLPTSEIFSLSDVGITTTQDGMTVESPKQDDKDDHFYNSTTGTGQRFFYLIESPEKFSHMEKGKLYEWGIGRDRMRSLGILQPYNHFVDGDP